MEIDITHMVEDSEIMCRLSGSVNELGENAAALTWNASLAYAKTNPLLANDTEIEIARAYLKELGIEDTKNASDTDIQALIVQLIAGDIREMNAYESYTEYQQSSEYGSASGSIFKDCDKYYFTLSH